VKSVLPDFQSEVRLSPLQRKRPGRAGTESASQCYLYESALVLLNAHASGRFPTWWLTRVCLWYTPNLGTRIRKLA